MLALLVPLTVALVGSPWGAVAAAAAVAVLALHELGVLSLRLPQNARQVPQTIVVEEQSRGALQFGFEMGTGVRTYMTSALPHALVAATLLAGSPTLALVGGLGFGAGRAAMTLSRFYADPPTWDRRFRRTYRPLKAALLAAFLLAFTTTVVAPLLP